MKRAAQIDVALMLETAERMAQWDAGSREFVRRVLAQEELPEEHTRARIAQKFPGYLRARYPRRSSVYRDATQGLEYLRDWFLSLPYSRGAADVQAVLDETE